MIVAWSALDHPYPEEPLVGWSRSSLAQVFAPPFALASSGLVRPRCVRPETSSPSVDQHVVGKDPKEVIFLVTRKAPVQTDRIDQSKFSYV